VADDIFANGSAIDKVAQEDDEISLGARRAVNPGSMQIPKELAHFAIAALWTSPIAYKPPARRSCWPASASDAPLLDLRTSQRPHWLRGPAISGPVRRR